MVKNDFGVTLRQMEQEKTPPWWQIALLGMVLAGGMYTFMVVTLSLPVLFPGYF